MAKAFNNKKSRKVEKESESRTNEEIEDKIYNDLPEDVILDIQVMFPVKSLLRFKCVCKPWYNLFQNPAFVKAHYLYQKNLDGGKFNNSNVLVKSMSTEKLNHHRPFQFSKLNQISDGTKNIHVPFVANWISGPSFVSSCNGLLCLFDSDKIVIWNPATAEFKILPESTVKRRSPGSKYDNLGFGYDSENDDYKVIRFAVSFSDNYYTQTTQVEIYTLNSNLWREIPYGDYITNRGSNFNTYVNGNYHWLSGREILSFDMTKETFRCTSLPDLGDVCHCLHLDVIEECLGVIVWPAEGEKRSFDLWVLEEIGVKATWTKKFSIGSAYGIERPLGIWKNGKMFAKSDKNELVLYDPKEEAIKSLEICSEKSVMQVIVYVESLVQVHRSSLV